MGRTFNISLICVFIITGACILMLAGYMMYNNHFRSIVGTKRIKYITYGIITMATGGISMVTGILGYIMMNTGNRGKLLQSCVNYCFVVLVLTLVATSLLAVTFLFIAVINLKDEFVRDYTELMKMYDVDEHTKELWNSTQRNGKCCGVRFAVDWLKVRSNITESCCRVPVKECNLTDWKYMHDTGCVKKVYKAIDRRVTQLGLVMLYITIAQILAGVGAWLLRNYGTLCPVGQ